MLLAVTLMLLVVGLAGRWAHRKQQRITEPDLEGRHACLDRQRA
jgi:hypothetical protein